MVYVPEGCAHGFQTLADDSEVFYQISEFYQPECSTGVRWNDPALAIPWPISNVIASKRDGALPSVEFSSRDPGLVIINEKRQIPQRSL
jgi:dTDP-4-dehydrorhamnose 3,5-epimerase